MARGPLGKVPAIQLPPNPESAQNEHAKTVCEVAQGLRYEPAGNSFQNTQGRLLQNYPR